MARTECGRSGIAGRLRYLLALLAVGSCVCLFVGPGAVAAPPGFVTAAGTHLAVDGQPFRAVGLNIYNANSNGLCWYPMDGTVLNDSLTSIGGSANVIRVWFFQQLATTDGVRDWTAFDRTLATAGAHGYKVIATLVDQWGNCGSATPGGYKDITWYRSGYTQPDPVGTVSYRSWAQEIAAKYKNNPTILAWQLVNEPEVLPAENGDCSEVPESTAASVLKAFATDVSSVIRAADPNHLISLGTLGGGQCGAQGDDYHDVMSVPDLDLCEFHDYDPSDPMPGDQFNGLQRRIDQCNALGKPVLVGELGVKPQDVGGTLRDRANVVDSKLCAQFGAGVAGVLLWAWDKDGSLTDNYDIGPSDPVLGVLAPWTDATHACSPGPSDPVDLPPQNSVAFPGALAFNGDTGKAFIGDLASDSLWVVDTSSDTVERTVPVAAYDVAVNAVTNRVYVAERYQNAIGVLDGQTDQVVATIPITSPSSNTCGCNEPVGLAIDPVRNLVYATNVTGTTITVVNGSTNAVKATISLPFNAQPDGVTVDPRTDLVYVSEAVSGAVAVIDGANDAVIAQISLAPNSEPAGLADDSAAGKLYVADYGSNTIAVIDTRTNSVVSTIPGGNQPRYLALDTAAHHLYVPHLAENFISVIDTRTFATSVNLPLAGGPYGIAADPISGQVVIGLVYAARVERLQDARAQAPEAPTQVVAAPGDAEASVSWVAPADGGNAITGYTVTASGGGGTTNVDGSATTAIVSGLTDGSSYSFTVTATNGVAAGPASTASNVVSPQAGAPTPQSVAADVPPGGVATSDPGAGATPLDPLTTAVQVPAGGEVGIAESGITEAAPAGYTFLGQEVYIDAPAATASAPLQLTFRIDASVVGSTAPAGVAIFRAEGAGSPTGVPDCTGVPGVANPDPCVSARTVLADGDLQLTVLTSTASAWDFGVTTEPKVTIDSVSKPVLGPGDASTKVGWHADENGTFSIRVGGTSCTSGTQLASGSYTGAPAVRSTTVNASSFAEGPNTIRVCVTSAASTNSAVTPVTKDTIAPTVIVEGVTPSVLSGGVSSTSLTWHANENGSYSVRVGGASCTAGTQVASGAYATAPATITTVINASSLGNGVSTLRVCVKDAAGNTGFATTTVTKDATPPTVTIDSATPSLLAASGSTVVTWHANENGAFAVLIGGSDCSGTPVAAGNYSGEPAKASTSIGAGLLAEGVNTIRVCVTDGAGNSGSKTTTVTKDTTQPVVVVDSVSPTPLGAGSATVTWHANENGVFSVRVGGTDCASGTELANGNYKGAPATHATAVKVTALAEGANTIRVCVTDAAGNVGVQTASVARDTTAPMVTVGDASPSVLGASTISTTLSWHAGENGNYSVRVGGGSCNAGTQVASGSYASAPATVTTIINASALASGSNTIRVCVTDQAGNTGSQMTSVKKDVTAPTITVAKPAGNATYKTGQAVLASYTCKDENGGSGIATCTGTVASGGAIDTSSPGTKTFTVTATDQAGNTSTKTVSYKVS